jgi:hypothetical protein
VHTRRQLEALSSNTQLSRGGLELMPYGVDTDFWQPIAVPEEAVIASAGREHRDYALLDRARDGLGHELVITATSLHSPGAACTLPSAASSAKIGHLDYTGLRDLYARAAVVVVPLLPNDFGAGVTALLEAMAMQKAVIVTDTDGLRGLVVDGETGLLVPPGNAEAMRAALARLLGNREERWRLGANAHRAVQSQFSLDQYVEALAKDLAEVAA